MSLAEIFNILGIELTKDEAAIRAAYREKLKQNNPEDHPEEFKRLRQAYEEALAYTKEEDKPAEEEDMTLSGRWVQKAASIYRSLSLRCSTDAWKALFMEDAFLSLEEGENCRKKLLTFLMKYYNMPHEIWQLLDKKLRITKEREQLKEFLPADFVGFIVRRCSHEVFNYKLFSGPDEGDYDSFIKLYYSAQDALNEGRAEEVEQIINQAAALGIRHPYMEVLRAQAYSMQGRDSEVRTIIKGLTEKHPEDLWILYHAGEYFVGKEEWEKAYPYFKRIQEQKSDHYMANVRLAQYYEGRAEFTAAQDCIRRIPQIKNDIQMQELLIRLNDQKKPKLEKAWKEDSDCAAALGLAQLLFDEKSYFAAFRVLESVKKQLKEEQRNTYYRLLAGVYMGMAEFDRAVDALEHCGEEGLYKPKVKISAYHNMGRGFAKYYTKAVEEYEKIKDDASKDIKLLIEMAQIYQEMKEFEKCLDLGKKLWEDYGISYGWILMMKAYAGMYDGGNVIYCGRQCIQAYPDYAYAYEEMAKVYYQTGHMEELKELLIRAKENGVESVYLDYLPYHGEEIPENFDIDGELKSFHTFYHEQLKRNANLNSYKYGYPVITKYLRMYPCRALLNRRGLFSMDAKDIEKAMADFRKILEDDPADPFAHNNIGCLYKYMEQYEEAITSFQKAIYYMYREDRPEPTTIHYGNLAHTYELMGAYDLALKIYLRIAEEFRKVNETMDDLIANYGRCGQLAPAKQLIDQHKFQDVNKYRRPLYHYRLHMYAGQWEEAERYIEQYKQVILYYADSDRTKSYWSRYYHMLAWNLMGKKQYDKAMEALEQAMEKMRTPSSSKKEKLDVLITKLFFLSLKDMEKEEKVQAELPKLSKSALFWSKLKKKNTTAAEEKTPVVDEAALQKAKVDETYQAMNKLLDQLCRKQLNDGKPRNPIATPDFFYKERYVKFVEFLLALQQEGEAAREALKEMEKSPRCRLCNQGGCMRLQLAKALLLEKEKNAQEARIVYEKLSQDMPYNAFARMKLLFMK